MTKPFTYDELSEHRSLLILTLLGARDELRTLKADQCVSEIYEVLETLKVRE